MSPPDLHRASPLDLARILRAGSFRARPRLPPPARVAARLAGRLHWQLIDRAGKVHREGEQSNLITNLGLNQIATTAIVQGGSSGQSTHSQTYPLIAYAATGTGNTTPDATDTALEGELARTNTTYSLDTITRSSAGVYSITKHFEFDYDEANGNNQEWGISWSSAAGNLFSRALYRDGGGDPETVTKTDDYKLRLIYTLEVTLTPAASYSSGGMTITGSAAGASSDGVLTGTYQLIGSDMDGNYRNVDLYLFTALARGVTGTASGASNTPDAGSLEAISTDQTGVAYDSEPTMQPSSAANLATAIDTAIPAYSSGTFTRSGGLWKFGTGDGNLTPIKGFRICGVKTVVNGADSPSPRVGYVFDLDADSEFTKDDEHTLTIGTPSVSWSRDT